MATPKQLAANRRNAQKSTGPKSSEAKQKVAQNRTRHGLCGSFRVLAGLEKQEEFDAYLNQLMEDEQPVGQTERDLVFKMAEHSWSAQRAIRLQNNCFVPKPQTPEQAQAGQVAITIDLQLERIIRYHASHDRAYQRASAQLQKLKKERRLAEIGFESQKRAQAEETRKTEKHAMTMAIGNVRKQREDVKLGNDLARILGPDFDPSSLNQLFSAAAKPNGM